MSQRYREDAHEYNEHSQVFTGGQSWVPQGTQHRHRAGGGRRSILTVHVAETVEQGYVTTAVTLEHL